MSEKMQSVSTRELMTNADEPQTGQSLSRVTCVAVLVFCSAVTGVLIAGYKSQADQLAQLAKTRELLTSVAAAATLPSAIGAGFTCTSKNGFVYHAPNLADLDGLCRQ